MARQGEVVLAEIAAAIAGIEETMAGCTQAEFAASWVRRHAVPRGLEIISGASRRLPDDRLAQPPSIPWRQIRDIGNVLRHADHAVDDAIIWSAARDDLPPLKQAVAALRADAKGRGGEGG